MEVSESLATVVPDLLIPPAGGVVLVERRERIRHSEKARWVGHEWLFLVTYETGSRRWIREVGEENVFEELEDQPSEEPIQSVSGAAGPI